VIIRMVVAFHSVVLASGSGARDASGGTGSPLTPMSVFCGGSWIILRTRSTRVSRVFCIVASAVSRSCGEREAEEVTA